MRDGVAGLQGVRKRDRGGTETVFKPWGSVNTTSKQSSSRLKMMEKSENLHSKYMVRIAQQLVEISY